MTQASFKRQLPEARGAALNLNVLSAGLCCAVGQRLDAASPALLANLDHFQQSEFQTIKGDAVRVARIPDEKAWGVDRVARWLALAVRDALENLPQERRTDFDPTSCALLLLCDDISETSESWGTELFEAFRGVSGQSFHPNSAVLPSGRAAFAALCSRAQSLLAEVEGVKTVLVAGSSSLLNARRINTLLRQQRLQAPGNPDGFLPGEGAGALLLELGGDGPLRLRAVGAAHEAADWTGAEPNRAEGLTAAVRAACEAAGLSTQDLGLRISDLNGEAFYAREAATAFTRLMQGGAQLPHVTPAGGLGEIGAAFAPAAVAYLWHRSQRALLPRGWPVDPCSHAILHLSDDRGLRGAVILELQPAWATAL